VTAGRGDIRFGRQSWSTGARAGARAGGVQLPTLRARVVGREDFFVFEPQANISVRLTKAVGVSCRRRLSGNGQRQPAGDRLNGPTANLAIQFGGSQS